MIVIRTKGNHKQGMGDIVGSIAIADCLKAKNEPCILAVDDDPEAVSAVKDSGHELVAFSSWNEEKKWWEKSKNIKCVVFNQLNSEKGKVVFVKNTCKCLVATVDDVGEAAAVADIRFNPLYHYPKSKTGPEYIPLKKVFQEMHGRKKKYSEKVEKFLVTLGGSDTWGFTPKVMKILQPLSDKLGKTTVITGSAYKHHAELKKTLKNWNGKIELLERVSAEEMARRMFEADLALCSGGLTLFEIACCGTPAAVLSNEPWELETAGAMEKLGYGVSLGFGKNLDEKFLSDTVKKFVSDCGFRKKHGANGRKLVDGCGAERIAKDIIKKVQKI